MPDASPEVDPGALDTLTALEGADISTVTAERLNALARSLDGLYARGGTDKERKEIRSRLAILRSRINSATVEEGATKVALNDLRRELDRRGAAFDHPDGNFFTGAVEAGINRYRVFEDEKLPETWQKWAMRSGLVVAGVAAARWLWNGLGFLGKSALTAGAAIGSVPWLPQSFRNSVSGFFDGIWNKVKTFLPSWMGGGESVPENISKQQEQTTKLIREFRAARTAPGSAAALIGPARKSIEAERALITALPEEGRKPFAVRLTFLEAAVRELDAAEAESKKIAAPGPVAPPEVKKAAEDKAAVERESGTLEEQINKAISSLDERTPNLMNPPTERVIAGVTVRFNPDGIYLDGRLLLIEARKNNVLGFPSPYFSVRLNSMARRGNNLIADADAIIVAIPIHQTPTFTPAQLAIALNRYRGIGGSLPYEEDQRDEAGALTGNRIKFRLA